MSVDPPTAQPIEQALADTLPLRRADRRWGLLDFIWVQSGLAIATWAFLFGGLTANYVGFWDGLWTMLLGNSIGVTLMLFGSALGTSKWGAEHYVIQRSIYGPIGVLVVLLVVAVPAGVGWTAILAVMVGKATTQVISELGSQPIAAPSLIEIPIGLLALAAGWLILMKGDRGLRLLNRFVAPALIVMSAVLLWAIFTQKTLMEIAAAPPLTPLGDRRSNLMLAIELNIACGMSWWSLAGNMARSAHTPRVAMWGSFIGYVPVGVLAQMVGLTAALVMGNPDPTKWMLPIVGPVLGIALLVLIGFANLTSLAGVVYGIVQPCIQHLGPRVQRLGWARATLIFVALCAVCVFFTTTKLYDYFFSFVAWLQAALVGLIGITIADYIMLRKERLSLAALYDVETTGTYSYWHRVNYVALLAFAVGAVVYVSLLNPMTLASAWIFKYISASIPAVLASMVTHVVLTRLIVIPAGKGGYSREV